MKKFYTILFLTLTASIAHAQWAGFTNTGGDGLWSNDANWAFPGGVTELASGQQIDIYQGPIAVTLDEAYIAKGVKIPDNKAESFTITGDNKLTINIADGAQSNTDTGIKAIFNESADPTNLIFDCDVTIANSEPSTGGNFNAVSVLSTVNGASSVNFVAGKTLELSGTASTSFWGPGAFHVNGNITGAQGVLIGGATGSGKLFLGSSTSDVSGFTGTVTLAANSELTLNSNGSTLTSPKLQVNGTPCTLTLETANVFTTNDLRVSRKSGQAFVLNMNLEANQSFGEIKIKGDGSTLNLNIDSSVTSVAFGANDTAGEWQSNAIINIIGYKEGVVSFGTDGNGLNGGARLANIRIDGQEAPMGEPLSLDANGNLIGAASLVLSTEKHNAFQFSMYPNPVKDVINFNSKEPLATVKAYDLLGKEVLNITQPRANINVSSLKRGMYILKLEAENGGIVTRKFIKE